MITTNIDGLPGLTMQGVKGSPGERGCTIFYGQKTDYVYTTIPTKWLGLVVTYDDSNVPSSFSYKCIPSENTVPILYDYFLNLENGYSNLYIISNILYFKINDYNGDIKYIGSEIEDDNFKVETSNSTIIIVDTEENKSPNFVTYIKNILKERLKIYATNSHLISIPPSEEELLSKYPVFVLKYLDTWLYSDSTPSNVDLGINIKTFNLNYNAWTGDYRTKTLSCTGHTFDVINFGSRQDVQYFVNSYDNRSATVHHSGFHFKILDASTYEPIVDVRTAHYTIYENLDRESCYTIEAFEQNREHIVKEEDFFEDAALHEISLADEDFHNAYMLLNVEGYFAGRIFLTDRENYIIYLFRNTLSDIVKNVRFTVTHNYPYLDSSEPVTTDDLKLTNELEEEPNLSIMQFIVKSQLTEEEKKKYKIVLEFTSTREKMCSMSTMRTQLWKEVGEAEQVVQNIEDEEYDEEQEPSELPRINYNYAHGYPENFSYDLNFDNEDLRDFSIVVKDYTEGNNVKTFTSAQFIPSFLAEQNYSINAYAYYKVSSDTITKIFLGNALFADTIS